MFVNANVYFDSAKSSTLSVERRDSGLVVVREGRALGTVEPLAAPDWYFERTSSGVEMGRVFQQHGKNALASALYSDCDLFKRSEECRYCRMGDGSVYGTLRAKRSRDLVETAQRALASNPAYQLDMNAGMTYTEGSGFELFIPRVKALRDALPSVPIAIEQVPPRKPEYLARAREAGADVVLLNLEVWDERLWREFCPGKAAWLSRAEYRDRLDYAVRVFGEGNVSSCLIAGLEPPDSTLAGARALLEQGVVPDVIAFRRTTDKMPPDVGIAALEYLTLSREVGSLLAKSGLKPEQQAGCVGCTGCSMEVDYAKP